MIRFVSLLLAAALLLACPVLAGAATGNPGKQARHHHHGRHHHKRRHRKHRRRHSHHARKAPARASNSCAGADLMPTAGDVAAVQAATLCLINEQRARRGERALLANGDLDRAAAAHSRDMVARGYFEHTSPGGQTPLQRIRASGFLPRGAFSFQVGENIAWGTRSLATPRAIVQSWMASSGHRANILDGAYRYTGIGVAAGVPGARAEGQPGAVYTQDFAAIS